MGELTIKYRYEIGQIVYFMHKNEVKKGIVSRIRISLEAGPIKTFLTEKIVNRIVKIFKKNYPFNGPDIIYELDLVSKTGKFESAPHILREYEVYGKKDEILQSL